MEFRILGTLEVWTGCERVSLPRARHQRVLAGLLLAPNSVVPLSRLVEMTWDDELPATRPAQRSRQAPQRQPARRGTGIRPARRSSGRKSSHTPSESRILLRLLRSACSFR